MEQQVTWLKTGKIRKVVCPKCSREIFLEKGAKEGDVILCYECNNKIVLIGIDKKLIPKELVEAKMKKKEEEISEDGIKPYLKGDIKSNGADFISEVISDIWADNETSVLCSECQKRVNFLISDGRYVIREEDEITV